jgi:hypothetical protein
MTVTIADIEQAEVLSKAAIRYAYAGKPEHAEDCIARIFNILRNANARSKTSTINAAGQLMKDHQEIIDSWFSAWVARERERIDRAFRRGTSAHHP